MQNEIIQIQLDLAEAYLEAQVPEKALELLQKPLGSPSLDLDEDPIMAQRQYLRGLAFHDLGRFEESAVSLESALNSGLLRRRIPRSSRGSVRERYFLGPNQWPC